MSSGMREANGSEWMSVSEIGVRKGELKTKAKQFYKGNIYKDRY